MWMLLTLRREHFIFRHKTDFTLSGSCTLDECGCDILHTVAWSELLQITPCERWLWILEQIRMCPTLRLSGLWLVSGCHPRPLIGQPLPQPRVDMMGAKIVLNRVILTFFAAFLSFLFYPRFSKSLPHKVGPRCSAMTQHRPLIGQDWNKNTFSLIKKQNNLIIKRCRTDIVKFRCKRAKHLLEFAFCDWILKVVCDLLTFYLRESLRTGHLCYQPITFDARHVIELRAYSDERIGNFCDSFWFYV